MIPRSTPLKRDPQRLAEWQHRSKPIPPFSARRLEAIAEGAVKSAARTRTGSATGFSRAVKLAIRTRAGGGDPSQARCEATGVFLGEHGGEFQHIVARGMGGTSDPVKNTAANGCLLSPQAHRVAESRDQAMRRKGFWLPQGTDPRMVPMTLWTGAKVWRAADGLGPDGTGYMVSPPESVAA